MEINLIFRIAAVGILVSVLCQILKHSGREEQAFLTSLAGLLLLLRPWNQGAKAVVSLADGSQQTISLSADGRYDLDGNGGITAHLVVEDNSIRFVESECPDHRCEGFGRLSREGDWAACLPAGISVVIEGG